MHAPVCLMHLRIQPPGLMPAGARSGDELIDLLCTALRQDSSSQDLEAENKVAAAAVGRVEAKVRMTHQ